MARFYFIPDEWEVSESLLKWTKDMGLTDKTIRDEVGAFKDHQYKRPMMKPDACWRNWVRNGIKWGSIVPVVQREYRTVEEVSEEQKAEDIRKWEEQMKRFRG